MNEVSQAADYRFYDHGAYLSLPRDVTPWVIEDLIPVGGLVNLFGSPKAGKSFAALGMAYAIADPAQNYWLDPAFKVRKHGKVAYLQIDTPRPAWHARLDLIQNKHHYHPPPGTLFFADASSAPYPFDCMNIGNHRWLKEQMAALVPDVIFIDTLREVHGSDEDSSTAMRNVIARLVDACKPAAIVLISHSRKGHRDKMGQVSNDDIMDAARGSSYVAGRMDMIARLTKCHLYTKGRSSLDGVYPVMQEEGTGLLIPNYSPGEMEMREVIKAVALVPDSNTITRMKMLRVMYPDHTSDQLRSKLDAAKEEKLLPDPKRMKYTQADVQSMIDRVAKGVHPTKDEPMPMVKVGSGEPALKKRKKNADERAPVRNPVADAMATPLTDQEMVDAAMANNKE